MTEGISLKTINPVVFDDNYFCEVNNKRCNFLSDFECHLFTDQNDLLEDLEQSENGYFLKCQQCKDHYQMNKQPAIKNDGSKFGNPKFVV